MRCRDAEYKKWLDLFKRNAVEFLEDEYVECDLLKELIDKEMTHMAKPIRDKIF
jgi:hypothetical protein